MMNPLTADSIRKPILVATSCLAVTAFFVVGSTAIAQDPDALLQEVQALLREPLPAPPDGVTLPPMRSDAELTQQLRAMLFSGEAVGQATAAAPRTSQPSAAAPAGGQAAAGNPVAGQIRVELPPAPPERYAPTASQSRPAALPNPIAIPLPPHPPKSQAPYALPRPPVSLPAPAAPVPPAARLPDPTIIPLPPHPPEEQAPWRQGV